MLLKAIGAFVKDAFFFRSFFWHVVNQGESHYCWVPVALLEVWTLQIIPWKVVTIKITPAFSVRKE